MVPEAAPFPHSFLLLLSLLLILLCSTSTRCFSPAFSHVFSVYLTLSILLYPRVTSFFRYPPRFSLNSFLNEVSPDSLSRSIFLLFAHLKYDLHLSTVNLILLLLPLPLSFSPLIAPYASYGQETCSVSAMVT